MVVSVAAPVEGQGELAEAPNDQVLSPEQEIEPDTATWRENPSVLAHVAPGSGQAWPETVWPAQFTSICQFAPKTLPSSVYWMAIVPDVQFTVPG